MKETELKNYLFGLLAKREYSEWELRQKLFNFTQDETLITDLLTEFKEKNWQSDSRFAKLLIAGNKKRYGNLKLRHQLLSRGIDPEALSVAFPSAEEEKAEALFLLKKKYGDFDAAPKAQQKYFRFLHGKGFAAEIIYAALHHWRRDDEA